MFKMSFNISLLRNIGYRQYHSKTGYYGYKVRKITDQLGAENEAATQNRIKNSNILRLVNNYRKHGHRKAQLDPLGLQILKPVSELNLSGYGLSLEDKQPYNLQGIMDTGKESATVSELVDILEDIYCGTLAIEFQHLHNEVERSWLEEEYESVHQSKISDDKRKQICELMLKSQVFDQFLGKKFMTVKRYGAEGAEGMMAFFAELLALSAESGIEDLLICIAHRGRLNLLTCLLGYPVTNMFRKMKGLSEFPDNVDTTGDVLSHLGISSDLTFGEKTVHTMLVPNSSHLEAVNPMCVGKARAKHMYKKTADYCMNDSSCLGDAILPVQVHGDAAFSAQGITAETFAMSMVPHYNTGGSIHIITNNQVGFTTPADRGRSSIYSSDVGKMVDCPVIHVNGDYPEEVVRACRLALSFRQLFRKDVIVDLMCWRRWGHNELDDAMFTNPGMYKIINDRQSVPDMYSEQLVEEKVLSQEEVQKTVGDYNKELNDHLEQMNNYTPKATHLEKQWAGMVQAPHEIQTWDTGINMDLLRYIGAKSVQYPKDFVIHKTLKKHHVAVRLKQLVEGTSLDWATAESMAIGSLLMQDYNVRLSGQDVGRGTFSHRHAMLVDQETSEPYIPLNDVAEDQKGYFEVCNSILSEEAVMAFDYGMSIDNPTCLCIWEAQFGDFFNGAQIIIDTMISSGETKWLTQSGMTILLPHGYDGAGPEHSSARVERWLQLTDSHDDAADGDHVNLHVANPTTPAQYFHLLRRQMVRNYRKPLVVFSPKTLLRLPAATSSILEMAPGTHFQPVLSDEAADSGAVKKVVFCSGKHFYALQKQRSAIAATDTAIVRVEGLCPFPMEALQKEVKKFPQAKSYIWSQEEPRNMGAWSFVSPRFENLVGIKLSFVGRPTMPAPATGIGKVFAKESEEILANTFA